jgi:hypothetical protein
LSTLALGTSDAGANSGRAPLALRYADIGVLIVALPIFIAAGLPLLGYAVCAVAWLAQHVLLLFAERGAAGALDRGDRRRALGTIGIATLGRVWLVTLAILLVGVLAEREDGLAAAVLTLVLVTVHFASLGFARLFYPDQQAAA